MASIFIPDSRFRTSSYYGVTYHALGDDSDCRKDWIKAENYFRLSIKLLSTVHKFHLAETYLEMALMYEKKGDRKNAAEHINKSLDIFRKLNSRKEIEKAQRLNGSCKMIQI